MNFIALTAGTAFDHLRGRRNGQRDDHRKDLRMAVRITNDDAVRVIVLDRPRARNALNTELMAELAAALSEADADHRVRAVVITGSQQTFCAGADLGALDGLTVSDSLAADGFGKRFFGQLHDCRKPTIAAVSGPAYGGGCELVLACDIAIGGQSSKYALPEVGLGLIPGGGAPSDSFARSENPRPCRCCSLGIRSRPIRPAPQV